MHTLADVKKRFPDAYSCGGEFIVYRNGKHIVLASFGNGGFSLTRQGQELMGVDEEVIEDVKVEPKPAKKPKEKKQEVVPDVNLDDLIGE